jgi:stage II sporulation protein D (peptidoglycan lytic transglycosylase)
VRTGAHVLAVLSLLLLAACSRDASRHDPSSAGAGLPHRDEPPLVRVLLSAVAEKSAFHVALDGSFRLSDAEDPDDILGEGRAPGRMMVRAVDDGVAVGNLTVHRESVRIDPGPTTFGIGRRIYRGVLVVTRTDDGLLSPVLEVDLETYVGGVVAGEMPAAFGAAALEAQVVAARTYALDCELSRRDEPWHLTDDTRSQMFVGLPMGAGADRFVAAVRATRGVVVMYDSRIFRAYYHSTCGGRTVGADEVFGGVAYPPLSGAECGTCDASPRRTWEVTVPAAKLAAASGVTGMISRVTVATRTPSTRAATLTIAAAKTRTMSAAAVRRALRDPALPSTWIEEIQPVAGGFRFRGRGYGHGVGLCQYGAAGRAARGWSARDILRDYYPGATVSRIY